MFARFALLASLTLAGSLLAGCGALPGATTGLKAESVAGKGFTKVGFGAEGGTQPALIRRANGEWLMVYVGTNVGERHLYATTSTDGKTFSAPELIESADYSDQAPVLAEDAQGVAHLFFASNRNGEHFELRHARYEGAQWTASTQIDGYTGVQDLAVAYSAGRFLLACEIQGDGLVVTTSADAKTFTERETIANAGFDPAAAFLPDGTALVAYTRSNEVLTRASKPGADWAAEAVAVKGTSRLRGPAMIWAGDHGKLVYAERQGATGTNYALREKRFDLKHQFTEGKPLAAFGGDANSPALAYDNHASIGLAWGMKLSSSQQGVAFTLDGWK
ncbi:MAG: hypothetical protein ACK46X_04645 [Candidatus Sericytochromatia bacterium]